MALVKCQICEEKSEKETMVVKIIGQKTKVNKYYHATCLENKELHEKERQILFDYICKLYEVDVPNGYVMKQMKDYHTKYNYRYAGMKMALEYFYDIKLNPLPDFQTIGILPYIYDEAKDYYTEQRRIQNMEYKEVEKKVTNIRPPKKVDRKRKIINMEEI